MIGHKCDGCEPEDDIERTDWDSDGTTATCEAWCRTCDVSWIETYTLTETTDG